MESWQRRHIKKNLPLLLENITFDTMLAAKLMAADKINDEDVDQIKHEVTSRDKVFKLLRILETRGNSFSVLTKALNDSKQSGAVKILLQGYIDNGTPNPLSECDITIDFQTFMSTKINMQGNLSTLQQAFPNINEKVFKDIFVNVRHEIDMLNHFLFRGTAPLKLIYDTIPPAPAFYIKRSISNRHELNLGIFEVNCSDIFVFRNIERHVLSNLVKPNLTSRSTEQIQELNSRFILLDNDEDWDELKKHPENQNPKHLIRSEPTTTGEQLLMILGDTCGESEQLWKFIRKPAEERKAYLSEGEFCENIGRKNLASGFCICDTPGMGKTFLLQNIARKVLKTYSDHIVAYFSLSELIPKLMKCKSELDRCSPSVALNAGIHEICTTEFSKALISNAIESKIIRLELFFDGVDEIPIEYLTFGKKFLKDLLASSATVRIYVISRPHLRRDMETTLGVISYDILPFTEENQTGFLVNTWQDKVSNPVKSTLCEVASKVLRHFRKNINREDSDMFGIPLLCYLLAEVYTCHAKLFSESRRKLEKIVISENSIYELYKRFFNIRFNCSSTYSSVDKRTDFDSKPPAVSICTKNKKRKLSVKNYISANNAQVESGEQCTDMDGIKRYHVWKALCLLVPQIADEYAQIFPAKIPLNLVFSIGILEETQKEANVSTRFIHRAFAEFLVAEFFEGFLQGNNEISPHSERFVNVAVKTVLATNRCSSNVRYGFKWCGKYGAVGIPPDHKVQTFEFVHSVIVSFINMILGDKTRNHNIVNPLVQKVFEDNILHFQSFQIFSALAYTNQFNILRLMKNILSNLPQKMLSNLRRSLLYESYTVKWGRVQPSSQILYLSSQYPRHWIIECLGIFRDCLQYNQKIAAALDNPPNFHIPLHRAVELANYEVVEYLVEKENISVKGRQLLYYCVHNSYGESEEKISRRMDVMKYLLSKSDALLHEIAFCDGNQEVGSPLLADFVHLDLVKCLINVGGALETTSYNGLSGGDTIIHQASRYMSPTDFDELVRFLIEDNGVEYLFPKFKLLNYILGECKNMQFQTLSRILKIPGVTTDDRDWCGYNTLLSAVWRNQSFQIVNELVRNGASATCENQFGKSALHLAAFRGNIEMVAYFLSAGLSLEQRDRDGNTPVLQANSRLELIQYFVEIGANIYATNNDFENIAHKAARWMRSADDFHDFVVLLSTKWKATNLLKAISKAKDYNGTPLYIRLYQDFFPIHTKTLCFLLKEIPDIDVNFVESSQNNLLHAAVYGLQNVSILKTLIDAGVNINLKNSEGHTALDLAKQYRNGETIEYIQSIYISTCGHS